MRIEKLGIMTTAIGMAFAPAAVAAIDLQVTEAFNGLSGEDGTVDWIEITNFGDTVADTANYWYDDDSQTIADGGNLDSFLLGQGESAVFLIDTAPADDVTYLTASEEFTAIWGAVSNLGQTNGGGGLGQGGDTITLLDGTDTIIHSLTYTGAEGNQLQSTEQLGDPIRLSVLGENGAYESGQFFNDNIGPSPDFLVSMVGSPGAVPEPASLVLLCSGAICLLARRRQS